MLNTLEMDITIMRSPWEEFAPPLAVCPLDGGCAANACGAAGCGANVCGVDGCVTAGCVVNACPINGCVVDGCLLNFTPLPGPFGVGDSGS